MSLYRFGDSSPLIHPGVFVAPGARIIGNVTIGEDSSIWYNCVLRGDVESIRIGARTNVQDGSVIHVTRRRHLTEIGDDGMLAAGAMLTPGKRIGRGELWAGRPAKLLRMLSDDDIARNRAGVAGYVELARQHRGSLA
jgi:carbonic anhydrase/acetyltransferase-like protein (isoleucine patch superfamily)